VDMGGERFWDTVKAGANWVYNLPSRAVGLLTRSSSGKSGPTLTGALNATARQWESAGLTAEEMGGIPEAYRYGAAAVGAFYVKTINDIGWVVATEGSARGFRSFREFKAECGSAGEGRVWHHIVEKRNAARFGAEAIHNPRNVVSMPAELNQQLANLYSSIRPDITRSETLTVRQWLSTQSFKAQYQFGLRAVESVRLGRW